jgi:polysaccharide biosynthesis/export protein
MKRQRTNRVMVGGGVKEPRLYYLPRGSCDLLSAIFAAGGLADDAGTSVEIRNPPDASHPAPTERIADGPNEPADIAQTAGHSESLPAATARTAQSYRVDLVSATRGGATTYPLQDGAIVMVERRDPPPVHVLGLVHKPGQFKYPMGEELRLLSAIALANGTKNQAADKVYVIRHVAGSAEGGQPTVIQVSLRRAKRHGEENLTLAPGDIISVEQTPATLLLDTLNVIRFAIGTSLTPLL